MPRKAPKADDPRKPQLEWLRSQLEEALNDPQHFAWNVVEDAWQQNDNHHIRACADALLADRSASRHPLEDLKEALALHDPAFAKLPINRYHAICSTMAPPHRKLSLTGVWLALARLAHAAGAFGCEVIEGKLSGPQLRSTTSRFRATSGV